jgi:hypothetical protein
MVAIETTGGEVQIIADPRALFWLGEAMQELAAWELPIEVENPFPMGLPIARECFGD